MQSSAWVNPSCKKLERQGERTARLKEAQAGPRKGSHAGRSSEPIELLVAHGLILIGPQPLLAFWRQNPDSALPPSLLLKSVPFTLTYLFLEKNAVMDTNHYFSRVLASTLFCWAPKKELSIHLLPNMNTAKGGLLCPACPFGYCPRAHTRLGAIDSLTGFKS